MVMVTLRKLLGSSFSAMLVERLGRTSELRSCNLAVVAWAQRLAGLVERCGVGLACAAFPVKESRR